MPNGKISCENCGWEAHQSYNALSGAFSCPSCRTESSFSTNSNNVKPKNNKEMNQQQENFSQGVVGAGIGSDGFLLWGKDQLGPDKSGNTESGFANDVSSQDMVGFGIGQQGFSLNPFDGQAINESNFGGNLGNLMTGVRSGFIRFTPAGILIRESFCGKYCKALGYMRSADKNAFKRCKASCKVNYVGAKTGKWKYPVAPEGAESSMSPEELAALSEQEVSAMPPSVVESQAKGVAAEEGSIPTPAAKSNTMMYVIIAAVVLIIVVALVMFMRRSKATA
jgi:hypothetical protein